ncbi:MAG: hypothetical protein N3I35_15760 [Clostridia bacterium]|nr:hypothetical protein [Clostridia bacterium]
MRIKRWFSTYYQEVVLVLLSLVIFNRNMPSAANINPWTATPWVVSYENGFVSRGLLGTILSKLIPVVTLNNLHLVFTVVYLIFLLGLLIPLIIILRKVNRDDTLYKFMLFFILNPATVGMYANKPNFGRFDVFMILITIICLVVLSIKRHIWIIPVLMTLGMLIHEAFLFMYAPIILAATLFSFFWNGKSKSILINFGVSAFTLLSSFLVLQLFGKAGNLELSVFSEKIQAHADFPIAKDMLNMEYYFSTKEHISYVLEFLVRHNMVFGLIFALMILIPTFLLFKYAWSYVFKKYTSQRLVFMLLCLATAGPFILCTIGIDYGRWLSSFIFANFLIIFYLIYNKVIDIKELSKRFSKSFYYIYLLIMIMYVMLGSMTELLEFI